MFDGQDVLSLDGDHLDISYRAEGSWPSMTPAGSIKNYTFGIGDPQAGPLVQLGLVTSLPEEPLDWRHVVDPPHFHGSDQFRVLAGGEWNVGGRPLHSGDFMFQEAGKVYREHPASHDPAWIVLVIGDRRGALPTIIAEADNPSVHLIRAGGGETIRRVSVCGTEQFLVVTGGSLTIGSDEYLPGDMRVQRAEEPMPALVAGADGCQLTLVIADRRHQPTEAAV